MMRSVVKSEFKKRWTAVAIALGISSDAMADIKTKVLKYDIETPQDLCQQVLNDWTAEEEDGDKVILGTLVEALQSAGLNDMAQHLTTEYPLLK